jgi:hypothetical protein
MYNNTNTDVKVSVEVSPQLGNHGKKTKETCTFMLFSLDSFFYICGVGSYWMINLFTRPTVSTYKREKRTKTKTKQNMLTLKI